jgi:hypothetical protein
MRMKTNKKMTSIYHLLRGGAIIQTFCLILAIVTTGCASTKITNREVLVTEKLPRPAHIWVYDFASTPTNIPADSAVAGTTINTKQTEEQTALGRELGIQIATELANDIQKMGLPGEVGTVETHPAVNDIVIRGYLVSVEQGSTAKRMTLGFGVGDSELKTIVEGYQMTATGLRKIGSGELNATGGKGPGAALGGAAWLVTGSPIGLIVGGGLKIYGEASGSAKVEGRAKQTAKEIGDVLKGRFKAEGWID